MTLILDLVQNIALLVALSVGYEIIRQRMSGKTVAHPLVVGILFGLVGIVGMMTPLRFAPGVIYDGRSIVLFSAGFIGGPMPAICAGILTAAYRLIIGGSGALAGVLVIVESVLAGSAYYILRMKDVRWNDTARLWGAGIALHAAMLATQFVIPGNVALLVVQRLGIVILAVYSAGLVLIARVFLDQEHRIRARAALVEREARYRSLFDNSHAVMLVIHPKNARIIDANPAATAFYGWSRDELRGMKITDINTLPPGRTLEGIRSAYTGERTRFEFRHRIADGSVRDVEVFGGTVTIAGEKLLFSIIHDITSRKEIERDLYMSQYCVDNAALGVFRISEEDGRIRAVNQEACRSLGFSREELLSLTVFDINPRMTAESWVDHRQRMRKVRRSSVEAIHRRKDGSEFPVEVSITYFEYDGEQFSFSFARDISDRKEAEREIQTSLKEKEVLLTEIHHRVKNNLAVIASLIGLQANSVNSEAEALGALEKTRDRIIAMAGIHNLLYQTEHLSGVDLGNYITQLVDKLRQTYSGGKRVETRYDIDSIYCDIGRAVPLGLIVNELVTNALKHAFPSDEKDAGIITISVKPASGGRYRLLVEDNGIGIGQSHAAGGQETLGLRLVEVLASQLGAELSIHGADGTRVEILFSRGS